MPPPVGQIQAVATYGEPFKKVRVRSEDTTGQMLEIAEPIFQPIGPSTKCAAMTVKSKLQNGTTIIEMTGGTKLLKSLSNCTNTNAAKIAEWIEDKKSRYQRLKKSSACVRIELVLISIYTGQSFFVDFTVLLRVCQSKAVQK